MLRDGTYPPINPFLFDVTSPYPLKTSAIFWLSDVFREHRNSTSGRDGLKL